MTGLIPLALLGATATALPGQRDITTAVDFAVTITPQGQLTVESHDLGGDIVSSVATYEEFHMPLGNRHEVVETIAMRGDSVDFTAGEKLAARRYRHDGWPKSDEALARLASR